MVGLMALEKVSSSVIVERGGPTKSLRDSCRFGIAIADNNPTRDQFSAGVIFLRVDKI